MRRPPREAGRAGIGARVPLLLLRGVLRLLFRVRVVGRARVPRGPLIICHNHLSWLDPFLVLAFLPAAPRIYVLGDHHAVAGTRFRYRVVNTLGLVIPVSPERAVTALREMREVLAGGGSLLIAPEGFSAEAQEGRLGPLAPSAAYLSLASGVPLLPIGFTGTKELWLRRPITMRIGAPLAPPAGAGRDRAAVAALTARLAAALAALLPGDRTRARWRPLRRWLTNLLA